MITYKKGNLLEDSSDALVNTVNTVGVMGKGIALQFKQAFPEVFREYERECKKGNIHVGQMHVVATNALIGPKYVINFPTKKHWKENSKIAYIKDGLEALLKVTRKLEINSIAIPPLGCGYGGLKWADVKPLIQKTFENESINVNVYVPAGSPVSDQMKIRTAKPNMTKARALLLASMSDYKGSGYRLSLLEVQKIAYFLQESGEPLKLNFEKNKYGPYAENLNFVLQRLEGHYIRGYGDRNSRANIYMINDANKKAKEFLSNDELSEQRLEKVQQVIYGFETPYGMELLATIHWILQSAGSVTLDQLIAEVHGWNRRKKEIFSPKHIETAWNHLRKLFNY